jgi:hypothetical protein
MEHSIENHKAFPAVAWFIFIAFALFTFYLTTELQSSSAQLSSRTMQNVEALQNAQ